MSRWLHQVNICQHISDDSLAELEDDDAVPDKVRNGVIAELQRIPAVAKAMERVIDAMRDAPSVWHFNMALEEMYDIGDAKRIWLGI